MNQDTKFRHPDSIEGIRHKAFPDRESHVCVVYGGAMEPMKTTLIFKKEDQSLPDTKRIVEEKNTQD